MILATAGMIVWLLITSPFAFILQSNQDSVLRRQVNLYYKYFSKGQYELMWEMSSKNFQKMNDNDKDKYIQNLRKAGKIKTKVIIKSIKFEGQKAKVNLMLGLWSNHDRKWFYEEQHNIWIFEDKKWRFDSQIEETD